LSARDDYLARWAHGDNSRPIRRRRRLVDTQILNGAQLRRFRLRAAAR